MERSQTDVQLSLSRRDFHRIMFSDKDGNEIRLSVYKGIDGIVYADLRYDGDNVVVHSERANV